MDKPIVIYDKIDNPSHQTHKLGRPLNSIQTELGLAITHVARNQKGGTLILDSVPPRHYEFYCISHLIEGHGVFWSKNDPTIRRFEPGNAVIITPGFIHLYGGDNDIYVEDTICFTGRIADVLHSQGFLTSGVFNIGHARRIAQIIEHSVKPSFEEQIRSSIMLEQLLMDIYAENRELSASRPGEISKLLLELHRTPEKWWTVSEMAEICLLSESHFRRIFQNYTGISPKEYIDQFKIRLAAELLSNTDLTLMQIARKLGYVDPFHFSRRFKNITGISPKEYRSRRVL